MQTESLWKRKEILSYLLAVREVQLPISRQGIPMPIDCSYWSHNHLLIAPVQFVHVAVDNNYAGCHALAFFHGSHTGSLPLFGINLGT